MGTPVIVRVVGAGGGGDTVTILCVNLLKFKLNSFLCLFVVTYCANS